MVISNLKLTTQILIHKSKAESVHLNTLRMIVSQTC